MSQIEPTYLRYIYDGLSKGSLNSQNSASLPNGFIGLFEQEFSAEIPMVERRGILKRLALWSLFKGAVSCELASNVLVEDEEETKALIDRYSKWFNSPSPGKYVLYRDRLRTYLLQKLSEHEVQELNETLISHLEKSLADEKGDESELYALEHLSTHMLVESQLDNNYKRFHEYVNREVLWPRQIKASKEYKWSQNGVQQSIKEAARRHNEVDTITSTVHSVKLTQEEQNNLTEILNYLRDGKHETVISRILSLKKNKRLGLFFTVIHELLYNDLHEPNEQKNALKEIIKTLNDCEVETINLSPLKFIKSCDLKLYPSELIFIYILKLNELGIDFQPLIIKNNITVVEIISLIENDGITKLNYNEIKLLNTMICNRYFRELVKCRIIKKSLKFEKYETSNIVFKNVDCLNNFHTIKPKITNPPKAPLFGAMAAEREFPKNFESLIIPYDDLIDDFLVIIDRIFSDSQYFFKGFLEEPEMDNYTISSSDLKYASVIDEVFELLIDYNLHSHLSDKTMDLIKNNILSFHHARLFVSLLIKLERFEEALSYLLHIEKSEDINKTDEWGAEYSINNAICEVIIKQHTNYLNKDFLVNVERLDSYMFKALCYMGIAENYFNSNDFDNGLKYIEISRSQINFFKDYNDGLKFDRNFLEKNLMLIALFSVITYERLGKEKIGFDYTYDFLKINKTLFDFQKKQLLDINPCFEKSMFFLSLAYKHSFPSKLIAEIKNSILDFLRNEANYIPNRGEQNNLYTNWKSYFRTISQFHLSNKTYIDLISFSTFIYEKGSLSERKFPLLVTSPIQYCRNFYEYYHFLDKSKSVIDYMLFEMENYLNDPTSKPPKLIKFIFENRKQNLDELSKIFNSKKINLIKKALDKFELANNNPFSVEAFIDSFSEDLPVIKKSEDKNKSFNKNLNQNIEDSPNKIKPTEKDFILKQNEFVDFLSYLPNEDMGNIHYGSGSEFLDFFIKEKQIKYIISSVDQSKHIFKKTYDETNINDTPIPLEGWKTGIIMPRDVCYIVFENIAEKLLKNNFISESIYVAETMLENNKVARFYIKLADYLFKNEPKKAKFYIKKALSLIESAEDIPIDCFGYCEGLEWPERGYSMLSIASYYSKIKDFDLSNIFIQKALNEIDIKNKHIEIEVLPKGEDKQVYRTRVNQSSIDFFKEKCIIELIKIGSIEKAIDLSKTINVETGYNYYAGLVSNYQGIYNKSLPYAFSRKRIANYFFQNKMINKAISFLLQDNKIDDLGKGIFLDEILDDINYVNLLKNYLRFFDNQKMLPYFINILVKKLTYETKSNVDYMYLSKFGIEMSKGYFDNEIIENVFMFYINNKSQYIVNSDDDIGKLKILSKIFKI